MFGVDDIGLLLGALSLLYAVVHDATKVARRIQVFANYRVDRLKLISDLRRQQSLLNLAISRLLAPILSKNEIDTLCNATSPAVWNNNQLTLQLQQLYHSDTLAVFEHARLAIVQSSSKFLRDVGVDRTPGLNTLETLDRARTNFNSNVSARLRYAIHASSIKEYFECIRNSIQDIYHAMSLLPDRVSQSRQASQNWIHSVKQTRRSAARLHEALSQHGAQCNHLSHQETTYLALSSSGSWSESSDGPLANLQTTHRFDLLLEASQQHLTPAQVLICSSDSVPLPDDIKAVQVNSGVCMLVDQSPLQPQKRHGFRANIDDGLVAAITTQVGGGGTTQASHPGQGPLSTDKATLLALLPHRKELSELERVTVAANLVDSVAHLAGTPWLTPDVTKSDIAFFDGPNQSASTQRGARFAKAYLSRILSVAQPTQQLASGYSSAYHQTIVLKMCVWLLEMCAADDRGHDSKIHQPLLAVMANAISWHEELCRSQAGVVLDAALGCLRLAMDSTLSFTDRDKDLEDFREKVMEPLRAADKALHPGR